MKTILFYIIPFIFWVTLVFSSTSMYKNAMLKTMKNPTSLETYHGYSPE